jgi:hypothetical protein
MKSKQSGGGRSRVKGKTKLKITHEDKIYTQKKQKIKELTKNKLKKEKNILFVAKKVNKAQEENPKK